MTITTNDSQIATRLLDPKTRRAAFEQMVDIYSEQLYWQIRRLVFVHEDADDILQNVFLKAWKNIDTFRNDSKLSTWLYRIALNESVDFIRKKKNETSLPAVEESLAQKLMADEYFDGDEIQATLQEAIASLPDKQRIVFTMKYFEEMKYSDMSNILGTTTGALKASYHIAVNKICEFFKLRN
ncbi:RNA polymerase sigma factor [Prevotella sp. P2-180]|uniref:RNA polymerase sigma factor n=1 Tax=Prevotella sp. P2-180 TaxID=2024224 RepID=UPI000B975905|nr:sigma-70 family RNA polymerase sigma factor [Prevotella sp. P2-180]MCI6338742.1 sigma-70 family RNA polymerase sigma factor [Prevotella sp.]MCI7090092.1 sigma-70 family RNA polymerase sigma factor [Prevotella sp.]MCI7257316.1 sigma-70 family RNA polymerase sigma factor [Prevotella sp.]MDD5783388.1 sigma-70 family RNA polymerase sigma factor [Prevotella sp.]MDD6863014.1 sigma-70 family RNA polymerase sigma factor [Prevotella sp.]